MRWQEAYRQEMNAAHAARLEGREGRARVCARRALGLLCAVWLDENGLPVPENALQRIRCLRDLPQAPVQVRQLAGYFLERVNAEKDLPSGVDLLAAVESIYARLVPGA